MSIPTWLQLVLCVAVALIAVTLLINSGTKKAYAKKNKKAKSIMKK